MAVISMLTDFGVRDAYVGVMKGVILGIDPGARLVDLTHEVAAGDITGGGFILGQAWTWFPEGCIHLAVVDPGVGSARKPLVALADNHWFVGPDNGLFTAVLESAEKVEIRELCRTDYRLEPVSRTFHGRDIFAPAAAWLSRGIDWEQFGPLLENPVRDPLLTRPELEGAGAAIRGVVAHVDRFGNLITNISRAVLRRHGGRGPYQLAWSGGRVSRMVETYAEAPTGEPVMLFGSSEYLEIAVNSGNAAEQTSIRRGDPVWLRDEGDHQTR